MTEGTEDQRRRPTDGSSMPRNIAGLWSAVAPHAWGLLIHVVPHTPQLLVRLLDLGLRAVPKKKK